MIRSKISALAREAENDPPSADPAATGGGRYRASERLQPLVRESVSHPDKRESFPEKSPASGKPALLPTRDAVGEYVGFAFQFELGSVPGKIRTAGGLPLLVDLFGCGRPRQLPEQPIPVHAHNEA